MSIDFRKLMKNPPPPVKPEFQALIARGNVTVAEYQSLSGSTADWEAIIPALDDEALAHVAEHYAKNMFPAHGTYDHAMVRRIVPEVAKRLRARAAGPGSPPQCPHGRGFNCAACYPGGRR